MVYAKCKENLACEDQRSSAAERLNMLTCKKICHSATVLKILIYFNPKISPFTVSHPLSLSP